MHTYPNTQNRMNVDSKASIQLALCDENICIIPL